MSSLQLRVRLGDAHVLSSQIIRTRAELWKPPLIDEFGSALADAHSKGVD